MSLSQKCFILALNSDQKQRIFDLLASGKTASEAAEDVSCSRATVQRLKRESKNDPLLQSVKAAAVAEQIANDSSQVLLTVEASKERGPLIKANLWEIHNGLAKLFGEVLKRTDPSDVSPRQLASIGKAAADIAVVFADYEDRMDGLELLGDEIKKLNEARTTTAA